MGSEITEIFKMKHNCFEIHPANISSVNAELKFAKLRSKTDQKSDSKFNVCQNQVVPLYNITNFSQILKENPKTIPSEEETSETESEDEDEDEHQTESQMKEEKDERDTYSRAETEESSSKKVSPTRPCTSSQNPLEAEPRSPSADTEQTSHHKSGTYC